MKSSINLLKAADDLTAGLHCGMDYRLADMSSLIRLQPETFRGSSRRPIVGNETVDTTGDRILREHLPVIHDAHSALATLGRLEQTTGSDEARQRSSPAHP